jgi:hypothetical protein
MPADGGWRKDQARLIGPGDLACQRAVGGKVHNAIARKLTLRA